MSSINIIDGLDDNKENIQLNEPIINLNEIKEEFITINFANDNLKLERHNPVFEKCEYLHDILKMDKTNKELNLKNIDIDIFKLIVDYANLKHEYEYEETRSSLKSIDLEECYGEEHGEEIAEFIENIYDKSRYNIDKIVHAALYLGYEELRRVCEIKLAVEIKKIIANGKNLDDILKKVNDFIGLEKTKDCEYTEKERNEKIELYQSLFPSFKVVR